MGNRTTPLKRTPTMDMLIHTLLTGTSATAFGVGSYLLTFEGKG